MLLDFLITMFNVGFNICPLFIMGRTILSIYRHPLFNFLLFYRAYSNTVLMAVFLLSSSLSDSLTAFFKLFFSRLLSKLLIDYPLAISVETCNFTVYLAWFNVAKRIATLNVIVSFHVSKNLNTFYDKLLAESSLCAIESVTSYLYFFF